MRNGLFTTAFVWMLSFTISAQAQVDLELQGAPLQTHDVIILGEIHDDPGHHLAQADIIRRMGNAGQRPSVILEMIPADLQAALDTHRRERPDDVDGLADVLRWRERGWGDFALYRPIFAAAIEFDLPILAGDLPAAERQALSRGGVEALGPERRADLGLSEELPEPLREAMAEAIDRGHCGLLPDESLPGMVAVQRARDGSMARAAIAAARNGPVVIITGQGHARRDWGVPYVLGRLAPELGVYAVTFSADDRTPDEGVYDAVEPVAPMERGGDPCDSLR